MPLQTSLSSDNFKKFKPLLCPPVAELQRLSRNVIRCLPLSRLPSTLPVKDKNSKPLGLYLIYFQTPTLFLLWYWISHYIAFKGRSGFPTSFSCRPIFPNWSSRSSIKIKKKRLWFITLFKIWLEINIINGDLTKEFSRSIELIELGPIFHDHTKKHNFQVIK